MAEQAKLPLGKLLIQKGVISEDQLRIALIEQRRSSEPLGKLLITLGFVTEATVREALSENLKQVSADLSSLVVDAIALKLIPKDVAKRYRVFPIVYERQADNLILAMADTSNIVALDQISAMLVKGITISTVLVNESDISRAIDQYYGFELSIDGILHEIETGEVSYQSMASPSDEYSQPMVRLIDALLADAVQNGASDIHFEPEQSFLRIRYRIDGILRQIRSLHKSYWPAMAVRLKVMSNMNIAEARAPQDGRISIKFSGRQIDFRASAQPTTHGENVVLRVLDRQKGIVPLDGLGLAEAELNLLKLMIARPDGVILVTGPTGSGKTTTLYSILNHINTESVNIMTLEDPVEYPMNMIRQTSVNESVKLGFADGIRSMMRQDPDIILVGEIRDRETAEMAFAAAMTGHQVYSTLHTSSAIGSVARLLDIGILPDIMAGNIIGIVAQRLVRRLCPHCKETVIADDVERRLLGLATSDAPASICRAVGCERCAHQGYKGRLAIMEILKMTAELDELTARRASSRELKNAARAAGFKGIVDDGVRRVLEGVTTLEEVGRVVDLTERLA
ncbi:type II secretion system protein E [Janthinobacterium sp. HH103]|uniref:GspE/PulE family protein n=1 Tax=unclassified Janthinobacterium TaxID=2610881 RepID=UPI00087352E7|nr:MULTISPECIES: ATPase, T2SS/T4P/T4SS family [unclassified Janthinobacterium]MCC7681917.1 Flp pilus assembly complex ATPase component TadA [Janthinobacterium sp. FW305-128]OEZ67821.1 type II secretion system protein E [Janthinobacterium sp. HH103]OEZ70239.1 type II secretion system protein E [Janthinobacterium sp. HH100]OEZ96495.1 type II secretion system protein E [Janthinobacterium sp. HH107]QOU74230.1 Type II/IV secretion system protein [Janthinobacterium sp. HH102]